jgi:hypothetical protein
MADNVIADAGSGGATFATDDIGGVHYPINKLTFGALDSQTIASNDQGAIDAGCQRVTLGSPDQHYRNVDANAEVEMAGGACTLMWMHLMNMTAAVAYVHLYDALAASVTPGSTTPTYTFPLPTQGDTNGAGVMLTLGSAGQRFTTGLTLVVTTTIDGSAGDPGTNGVFVNAGFDT